MDLMNGVRLGVAVPALSVKNRGRVAPCSALGTWETTTRSTVLPRSRESTPTGAKSGFGKMALFVPNPAHKPDFAQIPSVLYHRFRDPRQFRIVIFLKPTNPASGICTFR
jgi:hypothetical protein